MFIDKWVGQGVYHSIDGQNWYRNGMILGQTGTRKDDQCYGFYRDVLIQDENAYIFFIFHIEVEISKQMKALMSSNDHLYR
ncbi:hypothetical protein [Halalkalibacter alkalisediminis]|uniref:Uncharacterized protein n=1 Tax=Halalkalibacter alkalisediminis TaxID=935616 RepID=A0ABV6NJG0_9BACI|nr:hypothetical protein [Halalkalibacter alkalisediminis]